MFHLKHFSGWVVGKKGKNMTITNAQIKALIDVYNMIQNEKKGIPLLDISNDKVIKRYYKVLNDILKNKIQENNDYIMQFTSLRKELGNYE